MTPRIEEHAPRPPVEADARGLIARRCHIPRVGKAPRQGDKRSRPRFETLCAAGDEDGALDDIEVFILTSVHVQRSAAGRV